MMKRTFLRSCLKNEHKTQQPQDHKGKHKQLVITDSENPKIKKKTKWKGLTEEVHPKMQAGLT